MPVSLRALSRPSPGLRPAGLLLALLVVLGPARGAIAQPDASSAPLAGIAVEGNRWLSDELLVSVSQLEVGQAYREEELREAAYRVARLPFVLAADYALGEGTGEGGELTLQVVEARRWFFGADVEATRWAEPISLEGLDVEEDPVGGRLTAGRRFAAGRRGLFHLAAGGDASTAEAGYAHFDLGGRDVVLELGLSVSLCDADRDGAEIPGAPDEACRTEIIDLDLDPVFSTWSSEDDGYRARLRLFAPVRGNHAVELTASHRTTDFGHRRPAYAPDLFDGYDFEDLEELELGAFWVYRSTDDDLLPSRGLDLAAGVELDRLEADLRSFDLPLLFGIPLLFVEMETEALRASFRGARYWPLSGGHSVSLTLAAAVGRADLKSVPLRSRRVVSDTADTWSGSLAVGHALFLKRSVTSPRFRELRWESGAEIFEAATSPDFDLPENPLGGFRVSSGVALRTTWGAFRVELAYLDAG